MTIHAAPRALRALTAFSLALALSACAKDSAPTCPPGTYLDSAQPVCYPCPQGTPGYVIYTAQPSVPGVGGGGSGGGAGGGGADVGAGAGNDVLPGGGGTDAATALDVVTGSLETDAGAVPAPDATAGAGDAGVTPGGGSGSGGAPVQDPPDATGCIPCPLGFYCKQLASGPACVSYSCLNAPPATPTPGSGTGGSGGGTGGSGADAAGGTDTAGEVPGDAAPAGDSTEGPTPAPIP